MIKGKYIVLAITIILINLTGNTARNLTLRINNAYGPFEYLNKDGKPVGFTVDVFNAINNINRFNYNVKSDKEIFNFYSTVIDSTELVTSMDSVPTDSKFIVSQPYGYVDNDLITRIYSNISSWEDMNGKNVLIIKDSPLILQFEEHRVKPNFVFIKSVPDGLRLLSSGKYDAMISSNDAAYFYINKLELSNLSVKPLFCQPLAIRFVMLDTPSNQKVIKTINNALQAIRADGTYDSIYSKRFFPKEEETLAAFELCLIILGITIMMVLIIYILYIHWLYQAEKRKKNAPVFDDTPLITNIGKIYDSLPTVTVFFDNVGRIKFINHAGHDLVNASRKTRLHLGNFTLFNHTILNDEMIDNLKDNKAVNFTYNLISKDSIFNHLGDYVLPANKVYNIFIMPVANYGTALSGYLAYIYDITHLHTTEQTNLKYVTSLSQIADNKLLDISYYNSEDNMFYTFSNNTAVNTGITYENGLTYIHPLYRSIFIEEFLSILNGEKKTAKITIKKNSIKNPKYSSCDVTLNAIRVDSNNTIGISMVTTPTEIKQAMVIKNKELQDKLSFLQHSSGYQFLEYNPETDKYDIFTQSSAHKQFSSNQLLNMIHPDDCEKAVEIIEDIKAQKTTSAYLVIRYKIDNSNHYNYYGITLRSCNNDTPYSDKIIGVYHNITDNMQRLRELEEYKESTTVVCEMNYMGYFEYSPNDFEHLYIPYLFTEKYGIDDDNFTDCMDEESRMTFFSLIDKFNERSADVNNYHIRMKSPDSGKWVKFEFILNPIRDDINQEIYKYMGFMKEISIQNNEQ